MEHTHAHTPTNRHTYTQSLGRAPLVTSPINARPGGAGLPAPRRGGARLQRPTEASRGLWAFFPWRVRRTPSVALSRKNRE